jgi:4-amino-4-deoxy-L-arabinose transferase-like glycosyltransferase
VINKKLLLLILCSSLFIFISGVRSDLSLGDEVSHYRFAKDIYHAGRRVTFDSLYESGNPPGFLFNSAPLWHTLLALTWALTGGISFPVAQLYHTVYYALLILFTYLLGKELYGPKEALYAALIAATIPAIAAFSVVFYIDIPAVSLSILCLLFIVKRQFLLSGITLGLMYLTKRNACFFAPAFFFLVLYQAKAGIKEKAKSGLLFFIAALLFILPDSLWRENHLKLTKIVNGRETVIPTTAVFKGILDRLNLKDWTLRTSEYLNSSFLSFTDIIKYFGIVLIILLLLYVILKLYEKKDIILWLPVACYFLFFCFMFYPGSDIRYLLPVMPLLGILSSKVVSRWDKDWFKLSIITLCLFQLVGTVLYVRANRQIPEGLKEGFAYLRNETAPDALIIYPEYVILEKANRRFVWAGTSKTILENLFWNQDQKEVSELLKAGGVQYIAVKKSRIYDDSKVHHFGGYPKSFVERLPELSFLQLVFDNKDMSIWYIPNSDSASKG